jgi:hypothetical protein
MAAAREAMMEVEGMVVGGGVAAQGVGGGATLEACWAMEDQEGVAMAQAVTEVDWAVVG